MFSWYQVKNIFLPRHNQYVNPDRPADVITTKQLIPINIAGQVKIGNEMKTVKIYVYSGGSVSRFGMLFTAQQMMGQLNGIPGPIYEYAKSEMPGVRFGFLMGPPQASGGDEIKGIDLDGNRRFGWKQRPGMLTEGGVGSSSSNPYIETNIPGADGLETASWFRTADGQPIWLLANHITFPFTIGIQAGPRTAGLGADGMQGAFTNPSFSGNSQGDMAMIPPVVGRQVTANPSNSSTGGSRVLFTPLVTIEQVEGTMNEFTVIDNHPMTPMFTIND